MSVEDIKEWIEGHNDEALIADGFDDAIVGICERFGSNPVVAYDKDICIQILMDEFGESNEDDPAIDLREEAEDYFGYNVIGSYVGENTPVFLTFYPMEEEQDIKK